MSERYDILETLAELEARWTAPESERESVRALTEYFNRQVLRAALSEVRITSLTGDVDTLYAQLTGDDVSSGTRTVVKRKLAREGVPVDSVIDDFVSHQSVYLHLTDCEQLSYETAADDSSRVDMTREQLMALKQRLVLVTEDNLDRLDSRGLIAADSVTVLADIDVFCDHCETSYTLDVFLEDGGCDCAETPGPDQ